MFCLGSFLLPNDRLKPQGTEGLGFCGGTLNPKL